MATRTNTIERTSGKAKSYSKMEICNKALTAKSEWPDKDEFLDVIYWGRQIIGIIFGVIWGIIPLKGFLGLVLFAGLSSCVVYLYCTNFQNIDEEAYGGVFELVREGFLASAAGFLVAWIIFYTGMHYDAIMEAKAH